MKNQFPPNLDEDNPLFKTDGFRMFCFKVLPCSKRFCHDWTTCPFAHPAEKARRRDPRVCNYTGVACPECKKNIPCPRGDACTFAHNVFEYWLHPSRYRTQLCNDGINCNRKICFFAHTLDELRVSSVKVLAADAARVGGSPTSDGFDPFCLTPDNDSQKQPLHVSTSPVSPLSMGDQFDSFHSSGPSSRRSSMQLQKQRMSLDQAFIRPPQQQMLQQRNSIDMAELQLQHLQLAAMKAQLQLQQTAALQSLAAAQQQAATGQPLDQLAQMLTQLQLTNGHGMGGAEQMVPPALQGLLPQQQQMMMPNLTQVLFQQVLLQQQAQAQQNQSVHEQLLQQLQMSGLPADMPGPDLGMLGAGQGAAGFAAAGSVPRPPVHAAVGSPSQLDMPSPGRQAV